ncbi:hypothetical protein M8J75_008658 [Diaphorina citri]|nr:hypothetical protein M8J75_008658 [Diaphorina citri]
MAHCDRNQPRRECYTGQRTDARTLLLQFSLTEDESEERISAGNVEDKCRQAPHGEDIGITKRSSVALPSPNDLEKLFLEIVSSGSIKDLENFIHKHNFQDHINCVNIHGVSALQTAIIKNDVMMVKYLLSLPSIKVRDGALHAIQCDEINILKLILDWQKCHKPESEFKGHCNSNDFPKCITPLMLAAQLGRLEIVALLLERGHCIPYPHLPTCQCVQVCQNTDNLNSKPQPPSSIINIYRASCNPVYIFQTSDDPFLSAFCLSQDLEICSKFYHVFRSSYEELLHRTKQFTVDLIDCCRDASEVEIVLKRRKGTALMKSRFKYPLLMVAMDYRQKEFVAHPNVQQMLDCIWIGDWIDWEKYSQPYKFLIILSRIFLLPWITIVTLCLQKSSYGRFYSIPVNIMINAMASYCIFLFLLWHQSNQDKNFVKRGPPHSGSKRFFSVRWNIYEVFKCSLFVLTFMFWVAAYVSVRLYDQQDLERKYWHFLDPTLVAESLFAVATVMSFCNLLFLCQLSYDLGPMQVSVGKMTEDIMKFSVLFGIIMLAFTVGLCRFYQYYEGMIQVDPETDQVKRQEDSFINPMNTFRTLFWAIFCMSSMDAPAVIIENMNDTESNVNYINKHYFTEFTGYFLFAAFEILMVIVMLNMLSLILLRSHTSDIEWIFGRSQVYLPYMSDVATPPPFNIFAICLNVYRDFMKRRNCPEYWQEEEKDLKASDEDCSEDMGHFNKLMSLLVQRYFRRKSKAQQSHQDFGKRSCRSYEI